MDLNTRQLGNYLLLPVSVVFYLLSLVRKFLYRIGLLSTYHFDVAVVVVGNITVGGSGNWSILFLRVVFDMFFSFFRAQYSYT
jgi:tetraacyldisaccharide 4'-kinase